MSLNTLSARLRDALSEKGMSPAALALACSTTQATISNWLNDNVQVDHVKAVLLLRMSDALGVNPEWLLLGEGGRHPSARGITGALQSQELKLETLTVALQLVNEALEQRGRALPLAKRAELITAVYGLLNEGMPEAKVYQFAVLVAA